MDEPATHTIFRELSARAVSSLILPGALLVLQKVEDFADKFDNWYVKGIDGYERFLNFLDYYGDPHA